MEVPFFPAPPALGGAANSLSDVPDVASLIRTPPTTTTTVVCYCKRHDAFEPRRKHSCERKRHRPSRNLVYPRGVAKDSNRRQRVTELRVRMTRRHAENDAEEDEEDDNDVICASATPTTISDVQPPIKNVVEPTARTVAVQTVAGIPLRLRVLPSLRDIEEQDAASTNTKKFSSFWRHLRFLGRLSVSQFGLLWLLSIWTLAGAAAFCATEGPREKEQVVRLKDMQKDLAVGLATELRQLRTENEDEMEPLWSNKVRQYVAKHEKLLLLAVSSGYGEGGNDGQLWTFPGCVLFSISLITTLGFGAPVPRTTAGRTVAVIFAAIGIPAHFLLVMNVGILVAVRLQRYAAAKKFVHEDHEESTYLPHVPRWVKAMPFVCIGGYYLLGILCFGVARSRPLAASLLFPLDFTAAGGLSTTVGYVRILYALYLEGAVTIAAVAVAMLQVSATQSLTNVGLKYGLLTEA